MNTMCLIEKLWIDSSENAFSEAVGYEPIGYVENEILAQTFIDKVGMQKGDGWPISVGESLPILKYSILEQITQFSQQYYDNRRLKTNNWTF